MADTLALARVPKMDRVLAADSLTGLPWRREIVRRVAERELEALRVRVRAGELVEVPDLDAVAAEVRARLDALFGLHPRRVINATGVLL
ncbi:MAG TPA: hypothetical protein VFG69_09745, partial [Nannocystaceae bacterium]|nr:hypothetical protein [Nannocystaceae bacterium]